MKLKHLLFIGALLFITSCQTKKDTELDLSQITNEIRDLGQFEKVSYKLIDKSAIKIILENSSLENLDKKDFGKKSATKVYNFNEETKLYNTVWISIKYKKRKKMNNIPLPIKINSHITENLIYNSTEL